MLEGCDVEIPPECYEEGSTATSLPTLLSTLIIVFIIDLMVGVCMSLLQTEIGFGSSMKELFPSSVLKAEVMLLIGRSCNNKRSVYVQASTFFTCSYFSNCFFISMHVLNSCLYLRQKTILSDCCCSITFLRASKFFFRCSVSSI